MLSVLCELEAECDLSHPLLTVLLYPMPLPCIAIATARLSLYFYMFRSRVFAYSSLETDLLTRLNLLERRRCTLLLFGLAYMPQGRLRQEDRCT
jgi:hypothetical protein